MSSTPPPGYGLFAIHIATLGSTHDSVITCGFNNIGLVSAPTCNARLRTAMAAAGGPFIPAVMAGSFNVSSTYVLNNLAGILTTDTDITPITGTASLATPPINTAILVKKTTTVAGRQYRGRMFSPPINTIEANVGINGIITPSEVTSLTTKWQNLFAALVAQNLTPVLIHDPPLVGATPPPTTIQNFFISPLIGTIKRRIRQ